MVSDPSDVIWLKRWEKYLAGYPSNWPIEKLESDLSHITAAKLRGDHTYRNNLYDAVAQMISKKLEELKQERGEPK